MEGIGLYETEKIPLPIRLRTKKANASAEQRARNPRFFFLSLFHLSSVNACFWFNSLEPWIFFAVFHIPYGICNVAVRSKYIDSFFFGQFRFRLYRHLLDNVRRRAQLGV